MNQLTIGYHNIDLDEDVIKLGGVFIERHPSGFAIFDRDPRRDLDPDHPEHKRVWKEIVYVSIGAEDALLMLMYLEKRAGEFRDQIAQAAIERRQRA